MKFYIDYKKQPRPRAGCQGRQIDHADRALKLLQQFVGKPIVRGDRPLIVRHDITRDDESIIISLECDDFNSIWGTGERTVLLMMLIMEFQLRHGWVTPQAA